MRGDGCHALLVALTLRGIVFACSMAQNLDSFDLVLNIGDTSCTKAAVCCGGRCASPHAVPSVPDADGVSSEWDEFFHQIAPIASYKPWVTCVGTSSVRACACVSC